jgi:hypothetical protein
VSIGNGVGEVKETKKAAADQTAGVQPCHLPDGKFFQDTYGGSWFNYVE